MKKIFTTTLIYLLLSNTVKAQWNHIGPIDSSINITQPISTSCIDTSGNVYVSGALLGDNIYRWDKNKNNWSVLDIMPCYFVGYEGVVALHCDRYNNIYAAITKNSKYYIEKWNENSNTWSDLGNYTLLPFSFGSINSICSDSVGNIYAGGSILSGGGYEVAKWDKATNTWDKLGGFYSLAANSQIRTITTDKFGNIYAAGNFTNSSNKRYVAKWDKNTNNWSELGGINTLAASYNIYSLTTDSSGNVFAAGWFSNSNYNCYVAKWNKNTNTWSELGGLDGLRLVGYNGYIRTICSDVTGNIYASGELMNLGLYKYVAKWDKNTNTWSELGGNSSLKANNVINYINCDAKGNIYTGGDFTNKRGSQYVAKLDINTNTWSELGARKVIAVNRGIGAMCKDTSGNLYVAAGSNDSGNCYVGKWNPITNTLTELGGNNGLKANNTINSLCTDNLGNVYAAGYFKNFNNNGYVVKWDKTTNIWSELGGVDSLAANGYIFSICSDASGNIYAAGGFLNSSGKSYVAKWNRNTNTWGELGGNGSFNVNSGGIRSMCIDALGNIYVAGSFTNANGKQYVAVWNKTTNVWSELGGFNSLGANNNIYCMNSDYLGNIYVGGSFSNSSGNYYIAKWNKVTNIWSELGGVNTLAANSFIGSIATDFKGNVYAKGAFTDANCKEYVAKWDKATNIWSTLGGNNDFIGDVSFSNSLLIDSTTDRIYTSFAFRESNGGKTYWAYYQGTNLPIYLKTFSAIPQENKVLLQWQTATEINNNFFTVQRSSNSDNWQDIATIKGAGNSSVAKKYSSTDNNPLQGKSYYRIKQTDFNGRVSYSEIRQVVISKEQLAVGIYPNPAKDALHIIVDSKSILKIYNIVGKQMTTHNLTQGDNSINIEQLSQGVYIAMIETANGIITKKIIKE